MSSDLARRLRNVYRDWDSRLTILLDAADEIERQQAEIGRLRSRIAELEDPHYIKGLQAEIERLKALAESYLSANREAAEDIERLQSDKAAISQTASAYLHEIERLKRTAGERDDYTLARINENYTPKRINGEHD